MKHMKHIEAMKLMVEALSMPCDRWNATQTIKVNEALEAGRQAIEQAEQEPVNITDACEYADQRWAGADVPLEWLKHFVDALGIKGEA
jgi:hypothetical protein